MTTLKAIVQTASCTPSAKCWGRYKRVAVMIVDLDVLASIGRSFPEMISKRAQGVVRVVETWENMNVGTTSRCAYQRALAEAQELANKLNAELEESEDK